MKYPQQKDVWKSETLTLAYNDDGVLLYILVRFDGNGNSVVRYVVNNKGARVTYEKHDAAATAYQFACDKTKGEGTK